MEPSTLPLVSVEHVTLAVPGRTLSQDINFAVAAGEVVAIMGPSGVGKTTLLHAIAGIVIPTSGAITLGGTSISRLNAAHRSRFRLEHIGMVFQSGGLLPELSSVENVAFPLMMAGIRRSDAQRRATTILDVLGLGALIDAPPDHLSGGEMQRVGIARALVTHPLLVLADEPTGALDEATSFLVMDAFVNAAHERETAGIVVTHDPAMARRADRVLVLSADGVYATRSEKSSCEIPAEMVE